MAAPLNDRDLAAFLGDRADAGRIVRPGAPTPTVEAAAAALGVAPERIVKSLVFLARGVAVPSADGAPGAAGASGAAGDPDDPEPEAAWLVIAAGRARVHMPRLAAALGVSRRRVRLASPDRAAALTGFAVGAMPPFGHRAPLPTLVDAASVPEAGPIYGGGGARDALLEIDARTLHALTGARRVALTER